LIVSESMDDAASWRALRRRPRRKTFDAPDLARADAKARPIPVERVSASE